MFTATGHIQKIDLKIIAQILPSGIETLPITARPTPPEQVRKQVGHVFEPFLTGAGIIAPAFIATGILVIEVPLRAFLPRGVYLARIELLALLRVAKQIIGRRNCLKFRLLAAVAGMQVGVQLLGKLAIGFLDFVLRCGLGHTQNLVRVFAHRSVSRVS